MTGPTFADFFYEVHRRAPYPWQENLAQAAVAGTWPEAIAVPTRTGKTAVLDAAVFALGMSRGQQPRRAALRTFFVVDRRLIVDQAARHAEEIAKALSDAAAGTACRFVADRLTEFGGELPLKVRTLRGGMFEDTRYVDPLNQPLICLSTVDQVGSRLLLRGYGINERFRSMHAAFVGSDALMVLDEAHLSPAFLSTLRQVVRYQAEKPSIVPPLQVIQMSATGQSRELVNALRLSPEKDGPVVKSILEAARLAILVESSDLESTAVEQARALAESGARVVGIVVNRVASARDIRERLKIEPNAEAILLTGQIRPIDRDRLLQRYLRRIMADREGTPDTPLYVVATQTIEVGADLDFDALITEAAPLDALRQRFGRLNRRGTRPIFGARVIFRKTDKTDDPIYGSAVAATWKWLLAQATKRQKALEIDFGIAALDRLLNDDAAELTPPYRDAPVLLPAYLDCWVQTLPAPAPDPEVAPFLHGASEPAGDVTLVWRADLHPSHPEQWPAIVAMQPPSAQEGLPLSIRSARAWLAGSAGPPDGDVEGPEAVPESEELPNRPFLVWRGCADRSGFNASAASIRPGDTIVIPSSYGGSDEFGWFPRWAGLVEDVADLIAARRALAGKRRLCLRLHPSLSGQQTPEDDLAELELAGRWEPIATMLSDVQRSAAEPEVAEVAGKLLSFGATKCNVTEYPDGSGCVVTAIRKLKREDAFRFSDLNLPPDLPDDTDSESLSLSITEVTLRDHCAGVASWVSKFATACHLPATLEHDLVAAAKVHDVGKCDPRFQIVLGANMFSGIDALEPLAKGRACSEAEQRRRRKLARYPKQARHEVDSVAMIEGSVDVLKANDPELVVHLVGAHHGFGRSLPPVWAGEGSEELRYGSLTGTAGPLSPSQQYEWADRFWALNLRYGPWQLAYLETVLRHADWARSEEEAAECQN